jgi:hypothetical protein
MNSNYIIAKNNTNNYDELEYILNEINRNNVGSFIIVTGGIGDFLTIDYFFGYSLYKNIIFLTKQSLLLKNLLQTYSLTKKYFALNFDFDLIGKPGFDNSDELYLYFPIFKKKNIEIINISNIFQNLSEKNINKCTFKNYCFYKKTIMNIKSKFNLPDKYYVISPYTEDNRIFCVNCNQIHRQTNNCKLTRNFIHDDYINTINFLNKRNIVGVILSKVPIIIPMGMNVKNIINLSSITTLVDCVEILKNSSGYIGIDSFLSVIASKVEKCKLIHIKCNNAHGRKHKHIYWYNKKTFRLQNFINFEKLL